MRTNAFVKALLVVAVPITGLAYVATQRSPIDESQRVEAPRTRRALKRVEPIDLRSVDEPTPIDIQDLPVHVEPKWQPAPAPKVEPPNPPSKPTVREVLAGHSARQSKPSKVRMWGVHQPDTLIADDGARRPASELNKRNRSDDDRPSFVGGGTPGVSVEMETRD